MEPKIQAALNLLKEGLEYQRYFFKRTEDIGLFGVLREEGFFSSAHNPKPVESKDQKGYFSIPYWPALEYLEKISTQCSAGMHQEEAKALMAIIREVTRPQHEQKSDNYRTWYSFLRIMANLPTELITIEDVGLIRDWLDSNFDNSLVGGEIGKSLLPKLLNSPKSEDCKKAELIIEIVTTLKQTPDKNIASEKWQTAVNPFWLGNLFNKRNSTLIAKVCGKKAIEILTSRIREIYTATPDADRLSYISRPAIENNEQNLGEDSAEYVLLSILRDILTNYAAEDSIKNVKEFFESDLWIFKRLAIFTTNKDFLRYKDIFKDYFLQKKTELFGELVLHHEFYSLLQSNFHIFSGSEQKEIISTINALESGYEELDKKEKGNAHLRAQWFSAINGKGVPEADKLYKEYITILGSEPEHPEFLCWHGEWQFKSSFDANDFYKLRTATEIAGYLDQFSARNNFGEIAYEEMESHIKSRLKSEQSFFESILDELIDIKLVYHHAIIEGFRDLWNEKKPVDWEKIVPYCERLISEPRLWDDSSETNDRYNRKKWLPTGIAQLIESGIKDEDRTFDLKFLPRVKSIFELLLKLQPSETIEDGKEDIVNWAINRPRGRTLESFIVFALRYCHLGNVGGNKEKFWEEMRPLFDNELELVPHKGNYEFSTLAARYLPNIYWMSSAWVKKRMSDLFPNRNPKLVLNWRAALDGYSYVSTIYTVIYSLLKENGDFKKVLVEVEDHKRIRERIIDNISVSYLRGQELLSDQGSLFTEILEIWKPEDISDVIGLFWAHRDVEFKKNENSRILDFWKFCYNHIKGKESQNEEILSDLNLLAVFLKKIDEESKKWLLQSVRYVEKRYHATFLLEYLDRLADVSPKEVGEIYVEMLKETKPTFEEKNVKSVVLKLYKSGNTALADQICVVYVQAGHDFLRTAYNDNHKT